MFALYFEWNMSKKKKKIFTDLIKYIYKKVFMAFEYLENFALARLVWEFLQLVLWTSEHMPPF